MKKLVIIIGIVIFLSLVVGGISYFFEKSPSEQNLPEVQTIHSSCLGSNEVANLQYIGKQTIATSMDVVINDKSNGKEIFRFRVDGLVANHYHSIELFDCSVYIIRQFNYDPKTRRATPHYRIELWKYNYTGNGKKVLLFSETDANGNYTSYFDDDFRIDPLEIYVALEQRTRYSGEPEYALTIRNFMSERNDFVLKYDDLVNQYPSISGYFGFLKWTKNGSYFWARLFNGAYTLDFIRILRDVWRVEFLPAPDGILGGSALNVENGYITRHPGYEWTGIDIITEKIKKEWREQGKISSLYLYNLFTKEEILLATTTEPLWFFQPKWLSDTKLQYELPTGKKKIYRIDK